MSSQKTEHYELNQWLATDQVLRTDFNADNAKIDAALAGLASQVAGKAAQSAVTALTQTVSGKADQSALNSLTQTVNGKASQADLTALSQTVAGKADQADVDALVPKAGAQLIKRITFSDPDNWVNLDLTDINWDQWATVTVRFKPVLVSGDDYRITCNSATSYAMGSMVTQEFLFIMFSCFSETAPVRGVFWPAWEGNHLISWEIAYEELSHIEFGGADHDFQVGSVFEVWGTK